MLITRLTQRNLDPWNKTNNDKCKVNLIIYTRNVCWIFSFWPSYATACQVLNCYGVDDVSFVKEDVCLNFRNQYLTIHVAVKVSNCCYNFCEIFHYNSTLVLLVRYRIHQPKYVFKNRLVCRLSNQLCYLRQYVLCTATSSTHCEPVTTHFALQWNCYLFVWIAISTLLSASAPLPVLYVAVASECILYPTRIWRTDHFKYVINVWNFTQPNLRCFRIVLIRS